MYHTFLKNRSMKNKLFAQICEAVLVSNFTTPFYTWRFLVGPIIENLSILILFIRNINALIMVLCFTEIIAGRFLLLFGWKHFNSTNEEFMFRYLNLFNISFSFATQFSRWMLGILVQQNAKKKKFMDRRTKLNSTFFRII